MICAGIDAGSRAIKVVLWDAETFDVLAEGVADQGVKQDELAGRLFDRVLGDAGMGRSDVARIVATGYGRNLVTLADSTITEITCHARGVRHHVGDRDALVTALLNLLDNAYKYSGDDKHIVLRVCSNRHEVCFEVSDNGVGLSRVASRRVFKRFLPGRSGPFTQQ